MLFNLTGFLKTQCLGAICLFMAVIGQCQSPMRPPKVELTNKDTVGYSFCRKNDNRIENDLYLKPLFEKLFEQRTKGGRKINIVHIGDSHILGNFMTREVRTRLQQAFGDAGRGLIFPYRIAGTNGPTDYLMETNCRWTSGNCQRDRSETVPYGLTGFSLETNATNGYVGIKLRDTATSDTRLFTKVTVFHRNEKDAFDFEVKDESSGQNATLVIEDDRMASYYFDRPTSQCVIQNRKTGESQKSICLDGICLENELAGVMYHTIGVNGARFSDFTRAKFFSKQVGELFADLIILSFGTNEASDPNVTSASMNRQIDKLVKQLQEDSPGALIMLTTPADSYLHGKGFNPNMAEVSGAIRKYAFENQLPLWDLYAISGGLNSAAHWKSNGLMSGDSIHYSKSGYAVQGKLFYQSFIKGYNNYIDENIEPVKD